jgi:hypothetical protein
MLHDSTDRVLKRLGDLCDEISRDVKETGFMPPFGFQTQVKSPEVTITLEYHFPESLVPQQPKATFTQLG